MIAARHCEERSDEAIQKTEAPSTIRTASQPAIGGCSLRALPHCGMREPAVYIMASKRNGTLYTGVTSNLRKRAWEHREGVQAGFTRRYGCRLLVWYEWLETMPDAIAREKQIKAGSRRDKLRLIESMNPTWRDLYDDLA